MEIDVDSWNVTVNPEALLSNYMLRDSCVHLVCHAPTVSDVDDYKEWVFVGRAGFFIRVPPMHADDLFERLVELGGLKLCRSTHETAFIAGSQKISGGLLVRALHAAGVQEVRLNAFGMKAKYSDLGHNYGVESEPDSLNHFDIGLTVPTPHITLFRTKKRSRMIAERPPKGQNYPMLLELGRGMGSVCFHRLVEEEIAKIKLYPGLVHAVKCTSAKHLAVGPQNNRSWHTKLNSMAKKLERLESNDISLGGYRVELTVVSQTLDEAVKIATASRYLDHPTRYLPVKSISIPDEEYFDYVHLMIDAAREKLDVKNTHKRLIKLQKVQMMGMVDVANALGWNSGRRRGTQWDDAEAWWNQPREWLWCWDHWTNN